MRAAEAVVLRWADEVIFAARNVRRVASRASCLWTPLPVVCDVYVRQSSRRKPLAVSAEAGGAALCTGVVLPFSAAFSLIVANKTL